MAMNGKLNVAVILAVAIQAIGLVWYVSKIDSKVEVMYTKFQEANQETVIEAQVLMKLNLESLVEEVKELNKDKDRLRKQVTGLKQEIKEHKATHKTKDKKNKG
jgi:peptidoglycan hydrolase CwlO-like protein